MVYEEREIGHERDRPRGVRLHGVQMGLGASGPYAWRTKGMRVCDGSQGGMDHGHGYVPCTVLELMVMAKDAWMS
jgi:hypothetical protein